MLNIKVTGRDDGRVYREPYDCTITGKVRGGYAWHHFKTAKERDAFAQGAVLGASIERDQHTDNPQADADADTEHRQDGQDELDRETAERVERETSDADGRT